VYDTYSDNINHKTYRIFNESISLFGLEWLNYPYIYASKKRHFPLKESVSVIDPIQYCLAVATLPDHFETFTTTLGPYRTFIAYIETDVAVSDLLRKW
jgi:hypothetical protein